MTDRLRLAYADPPYLGCAHLYPEHPDAGRWDDPAAHAELIAELESGYDGWALSMSAKSLPALAPFTPAGARIAAWVKPFAAYKRNVRIAYTWEPLMVKPARMSSTTGALVTRDHLSAPIATRRGLTGAKPEVFCRWVLALLGYLEGDDVTDMFPGTGIMGAITRQTALA